MLSSPTILATDNEEASIVVGQNVPFLASTASSETNLNNTFNQIDRQDVGITLRISPQISSRDFVTLKIFTEVSSVIPATLLSTLGPTTTIRTSETTAIAKDGQMIVIGGLISDDISTDETGVPFLRDLPVFGYFFRDSTDSQKKKNLLIFIVPRIIQDQFDHRDITVARRDEMEDEIAYREVYPAREEVLGSPNIDSVTEIHSAENVQKPSTIFNPVKPTAEAVKVRVSNLGSSGNSPIVVKLSPKNSTGGTFSAATSSIQPKQVSQGRALFVVLQSSAGHAAASSLPFVLDHEGQTGIIIPEESSSAARNFFQAGTEYNYRVQDGQIRLTVTGVYPSADEASSMHPGLQQWYTLSPYEVMNLGSGPWVHG
ncbi:MAG: hypothetical protein GX589_11385 [Deltaproteobacteria bacterium]|nr:hypothetical protein [Deltaproteobacteria bacterium]